MIPSTKTSQQQEMITGNKSGLIEDLVTIVMYLLLGLFIIPFLPFVIAMFFLRGCVRFLIS